MPWKKQIRSKRNDLRRKKDAENIRTVPIECRAVGHGFKEDSEEKDVKAVLEKTIKATGMKEVEFDMNDVKENLTKVAESLTKISDDNNARERKFDNFIKNLYIGLNERDKRMDEKIDRMERHTDAKIDQKLAGLDTRISAIERGPTGAGHRRFHDAQGRWGSHSNGLQSRSAWIQN